MRDMKLVTRRSVISTFAVFGLVAIASTNRVLEAHSQQEIYGLVVAKLAGYYRDKKSASEIGMRYLEKVPEEAQIGKIASLICQPGTDDYKRLASANSAAVRSLISRWQREDFEHDRIVNVSGWLLSETEARLCALAALTDGRSGGCSGRISPV
jgi:hypothetical protein